MPFANEHSARVIEPDRFENESIKRINIDNGVDAIIGKLIGETSTTIQSYRFDSSLFDEAKAKEWLSKHSVDSYTFELSKPQNAVYNLPIVGVIGEDFTYTDLLLHLNTAKDYQTIQLQINSVGGFVEEGLKIREAIIETGKNIIARNIGDVMSIAVSIFLAAPKGNRFFNPSKGQFLIHNPFIDPMDLVDILNADSLTEMGKEMKSLEKQIASQYSEATGSSEEILKAFMNEEKYLTAEQIEQLGFAKIETVTAKAMAIYKPFKYDKMEVKEQNEKIGRIEASINKLMRLLFPVKNMVLQDVNGTELDFGESIQTVEQIVVGVTATANGTAASGEYVMEDGTVYVFENGTLSEIKATEMDETAELKKQVEALTAENNALKSENETVKNQLETVKNEAKKEVDLIKNEFSVFKNQFTKEPPVQNAPENPNPPKKGFTYKK